MATVIDSLVVLLGLDASNYKKGREQAQKETDETSRKVQESADHITKSLLDVGKSVATLFLGFETASGFGKWLAGLNSGEATLGRTAANIGMSAHELNKWGNAVKLAGGDASDAQGEFSQLTEDFQKMNTTGEQSALLQFLRARSVNIRDANGNLRNQGEILEELADKTAQYGRQYQVTMFRQAGLSQGEINYLTQSKALREDQLRLAERNNGVTEDSVAKAQKLQEYWRNIGTQIESVGQKILTTVTPAIEKTLGFVMQMFDEFKNTGGLDRIAQTFRIIGGFAQAIGNSVKYWSGSDSPISKFNDYNNFMFKQYGKLLDLLDPGKVNKPSTRAPSGPATPVVSPSADTTGRYAPPPGSKAARFNNPGNILDAAGNERQYATPEEGQAALERDLAIKMRRGLKTVDAIITAYEGNGKFKNDVPAYIADVRKQLGKNELNEGDIKALSYAIGRHESGPGLQAGPTPGLASRAAGGGAQAAGNQTTVSVGTIQVNAPNADPKAVADQVPAAIQRKFSVTQADTGQS